MVRDLKNEINPLFDQNEYIGKYTDHIYNWKCVRCDGVFSSRFFGCHFPYPRCPSCDGIYSDLESLIKEFLTENNIEFFHRKRKLLSNNKEIDFYIPTFNIGIEVNGLYFHTEKNLYKNYHLEKTEECIKNNTKLIHIFTDEFKFKWKIVKSRLKNILKLNKYKIFARKCEVRKIESDVCGKFLEKYHIQGNSRSPIRMGLFYKNRLVSVMCFSKPRAALGGKYNKTNSYELVRFCVINNFSVVGGASKLLKFFEKTYLPTEIISYADRRWSIGELYEKLGFDFIHNTSPNYWYTKNFETRIHRFGYQKHLLKYKLDNFDMNKTEHENMLNNGFFRVYDCGSMKFIKKLPTPFESG
jgi:hypothetical protein